MRRPAVRRPRRRPAAGRVGAQDREARLADRLEIAIDLLGIGIQIPVAARCERAVSHAPEREPALPDREELAVDAHAPVRSKDAPLSFGLGARRGPGGNRRSIGSGHADRGPVPDGAQIHTVGSPIPSQRSLLPVVFLDS